MIIIIIIWWACLFKWVCGSGGKSLLLMGFWDESSLVPCLVGEKTEKNERKNGIWVFFFLCCFGLWKWKPLKTMVIVGLVAVKWGFMFVLLGYQIVKGNLSFKISITLFFPASFSVTRQRITLSMFRSFASALLLNWVLFCFFAFAVFRFSFFTFFLLDHAACLWNGCRSFSIFILWYDLGFSSLYFW